MKNRNFMKAMLFTLVILMVNSTLTAATWYVRPSGGTYGSEDGTSYVDAWDGFGNIIWGTNGVMAGDTLYICGIHDESLLIGAAGSYGSPITIRGDYTGDPGIIDRSVNIKGTIADWTETASGSNIWYYSYNATQEPHVMLENKFARRVYALAELVNEGEFYRNVAWPYDKIHLYSIGNPATRFSSIRLIATPNSPSTDTRLYGIKIDSKNYITIHGMTVRKIGSRNYDNYNSNDGAIVITNSQYSTISNNHIIESTRGIVVAAGAHHATVEDNFIEKSFRRTTSNIYSQAWGILAVANYPIIRRNKINNLITFYDNTTMPSGKGIEMLPIDYPDNYCYQARVYRNEITQTFHFGLWFYNYSHNATGDGINDIDAHVYENYIHDTTYYPEFNNTELDAIGFGCDANTAADQAMFKDNHYTGVHIYRNIIKNYPSSAIIVANDWDDLHIYDNLIVNCSSFAAAGIYLSLWDDTLKSGEIFNNTIVGCGNEGIINYSNVPAGGIGLKINNNIITDIYLKSPGHGRAVWNSSVANVSGGNNCFYNIENANSTYNFSNATDLAGINPQFVDAANNNFRLAITSPCIDAGTAANHTVDLTGRSIGKPDIGCYESPYDSLVCWLRLDENSDTTTADETVYKNDGTLVGSPTWGSGVIGSAVKFNASWSEYIDCGNDDSLNGLANYTISCWVKLDAASSGSNRNIIMKYDGSKPNGFLLRMATGSNINFEQVSNGKVWNSNLIASAPFPQDGNFHHAAVTFVYDGTNCTSKLYIDGVLADTGTDVATPDISTASSKLQLGTGVFDGTIDEVKIYSRVLSAAEILACRDMSSGSLDCFLKLDENSGSIAYDTTANANDGLLSSVLGTDSWITGLIGTAIDFNASWSEYINCGNNDSLNNQSNYSLSCWVKTDSNSSGNSNRNILTKYDGAAPNGFILRLEANNTISFGQTTNGAFWNGNLNVSTAFPHDGKFHHVAVTFAYDGTTCTTKLYLDGILMATGTDIASPDVSSSDLLIGSGVFDGIIDEVKVYSRKLPELEIFRQAKLWETEN
ncbi:MAG: hypothetical protein L3J71_04505 [Victivallaceae bacterium]|nr:hypothetical protein [Victivallaceae bacterium]